MNNENITDKDNSIAVLGVPLGSSDWLTPVENWRTVGALMPRAQFSSDAYLNQRLFCKNLNVALFLSGLFEPLTVAGQALNSVARKVLEINTPMPDDRGSVFEEGDL